MLVNLTLINSFDTIFTCPYTIDTSFPTKCRSESFSNFEFFFLAFQHDVDEDDYHTNGAGYHHSHKYGFGLLDSWRLVNTAKAWAAVPWMTSWSTPVIHVGKQIPSSSNRLVEKYHGMLETTATQKQLGNHFE